jgi:hypothetical protein
MRRLSLDAVDWRTALKLLVAAALWAGMIYAHGCHSHEDNELFTNYVSRTR